MGKENWIWMPHPAHFICARDCRFFLATYIPSKFAGNLGHPGYIISTVGEYLPDEPVRNILARSREIEINGIGDSRLADYLEKVGYEDVGCGRKYETMVFAAEAAPANDYQCCPYRGARPMLELDFTGYNDPTKAYQGHLDMCIKWDRGEG